MNGSTDYGQNPTLLACGHLAEGFAGFAWSGGVSKRECLRCAREKGADARYQPVVVTAWDIDLTGLGGDT